ncbi:hypothetical protein HK405_007479, partial [Cladochytrium tenue]
MPAVVVATTAGTPGTVAAAHPQRSSPRRPPWLLLQQRPPKPPPDIAEPAETHPSTTMSALAHKRSPRRASRSSPTPPASASSQAALAPNAPSSSGSTTKRRRPTMTATNAAGSPPPSSSTGLSRLTAGPSPPPASKRPSSPQQRTVLPSGSPAAATTRLAGRSGSQKPPSPPASPTSSVSSLAARRPRRPSRSSVAGSASGQTRGTQTNTIFLTRRSRQGSVASVATVRSSTSRASQARSLARFREARRPARLEEAEDEDRPWTIVEAVERAFEASKAAAERAIAEERRARERIMAEEMERRLRLAKLPSARKRPSVIAVSGLPVPAVTAKTYALHKPLNADTPPSLTPRTSSSGPTGGTPTFRTARKGEPLSPPPTPRTPPSARSPSFAGKRPTNATSRSPSVSSPSRQPTGQRKPSFAAGMSAPRARSPRPAKVNPASAFGLSKTITGSSGPRPPIPGSPVSGSGESEKKSMSSTSTRNSLTGKSAGKVKGKAAASSAKDETWRSNTSAESGRSRGRSSFTTKASTRVRSPASTGRSGRDEAARPGVASEQRRVGLVKIISAAVGQGTVAAVNSLFHRPARRSILGPPRSEQPRTIRSKKTVPQPNEGGDSQTGQRQARFVSKLPRRARADSIRPDAREKAASPAKVFPGARWPSNLSPKPTSAASSPPPPRVSSSSGTSAGIPSPPTDVLQRPSQSSSNTSGANPPDVNPDTSPANDAEANVRQQDLEVAERTEGKVGAPILPTVPTDNAVAVPASDTPAILAETPQVENVTALFDPLSQQQLADSKPPGQRLAALLSPSPLRPLSSPVSSSSLISPDPEVRPTLSVSLRPDAFGMYSPSSSTPASKAAESERAAVDARRLPKWRAMVQREVTCSLERAGTAEDTAFSWPAPDEQGGMLRVSNKILSAMRIPRRVALDRVFVFARSEKFAKRICKGIPNAWRGHVWYYLFTAMGTSSDVGAEDQLDVTLIQEYYARQSSECIYAEEIELEAQSALSGHAMFAAPDGPGQRGIRRILNAFTQRDPEFGFNAAMVKIVAMLLLYMEEERAYVALLHLYNVAPTISGRFGLRNLHVSGFPGLPEVLFLHDELMEIYAPRLKVKLESLNLKTIQYAAHWYLSLFSDCTPTPGLLELDNIAAELNRMLAAAAELSINTGNLTAEMALETFDSLLPFRVLVRLWDLYALHGSDILCVIGVALLRHHE